MGGGGRDYSELESIEYSETVAWRHWRIQRLPDAGIPAWAPKLCAQIKKKLMQNNINYLIISSACTPSQTPFNLKSNVLEIVELKTLIIPVSATQFCLNVSQSIVCKKKSSFYIVPVCPKLPGIAQRSSVKKLFLKILKIHRKTPVSGSLF